MSLGQKQKMAIFQVAAKTTVRETAYCRGVRIDIENNKKGYLRRRYVFCGTYTQFTRLLFLGLFEYTCAYCPAYTRRTTLHVLSGVSSSERSKVGTFCPRISLCFVQECFSSQKIREHEKNKDNAPYKIAEGVSERANRSSAKPYGDYKYINPFALLNGSFVQSVHLSA